jgi:hypothetical protein
MRRHSHVSTPHTILRVNLEGCVCVHAHDIYLTIRDGGDGEAIDVVDLGLSMMEATTIYGLKPEEVKEEKAHRISDKLLRNLPENEL